MQYIKVLATDSTNTELKRRLARNPRISDTSLFAQNQKQGRGQRGTQWISDGSKNLTFSILLNNLTLQAQDNFKLNAGVSLSICQFLKKFTPNLNFYIKWPNDILAEDLKLCGILIENFLHGQQIKSSIIGVGLNTNQVDFDKLPKATSLKSLTQSEFNLEQLWRQLTKNIEKDLTVFLEMPLDEIRELYATHLYRKGIKSQFELPDGTLKEGTIIGVSNLGMLQVQFSTQLEEFQLKEIKLLY